MKGTNPYCLNLFSSDTCTEGEVRVVPNIASINGGIMCQGCFDSWVTWLTDGGLFTVLNPAPRWESLEIYELAKGTK